MNFFVADLCQTPTWYSARYKACGRQSGNNQSGKEATSSRAAFQKTRIDRCKLDQVEHLSIKHDR